MKPTAMVRLRALPLAAVLASMVALAPLAPVPAAAQDGPAGGHPPTLEEALAVLEVWLDAQRDYERIPGLSAALVHDQETVWSGAYGYAHPDRGAPATTETLYSICSISKLFTSVAVMQLRDRGLLALSDPVEEHLPYFRVKQAFPDDPPVTVEGLLTHSSGLPRESNHPYWSGPDFPFPTRQEVIDELGNQETIYPAWTYYQYSNLAMTLAGELVRELSGMPYGEYVRRSVLEPLGMDDTYPDIPEEHRGGRLATGYGSLDRTGERPEMPFFQARGIAPAAGFASTVEDLAAFAKWQFRMSGDRVEVLHAHTLAEMHRVHWIDPGWETFRGLGFGVYRRNDETFVGHGGSCPGFRSQLLLKPDDRIAMVFMANGMLGTSTYVNGMYDLVGPVLKRTAGDEEETAAAHGEGERAAPGEAAGPSPGPPDLAVYVGAYGTQPWGGETAVVRWGGGLAMMGLPTSNPVRALTRLRHEEGHTFRRVRDDGEPGEAVEFVVEDGRAVAYRQWTNVYRRIDGTP